MPSPPRREDVKWVIVGHLRASRRDPVQEEGVISLLSTTNSQLAKFVDDLGVCEVIFELLQKYESGRCGS